MGRSSKIRHRRRRTIGWLREQAYRALIRDMESKGTCAPGFTETRRFKNLVEARLRR